MSQEELPPNIPQPSPDVGSNPISPERKKRIDAAVFASLILTGCGIPEPFKIPGQEALKTESYALTAVDREKTHVTAFTEGGTKILESLGASDEEKRIFGQESENTFVHLSVGDTHYLAPMVNERIWFQDKEIRLHVKTPLKLIAKGYLTPAQWDQILEEIRAEAPVRFALPTRLSSPEDANLHATFVPSINNTKTEAVGAARLVYDFLPASNNRFIVANKGDSIELDEEDIIAALMREGDEDPLSQEEGFEFLKNFIKTVTLHEIGHELANPEHSQVKNSVLAQFKPDDRAMKITVGHRDEKGNFIKTKSTYHPYSYLLKPTKDPITSYYHSLQKIFSHPSFNKESLSWSTMSE